MTDVPLPRKRKKFTIKPIVKRKHVISGFIFEDPARGVLKKGDKRAITSKEIQKSYPQITKFQLDDARFIYDDFKAYVELNQYSEPTQAKAQTSKLKPPK